MELCAENIESSRSKSVADCNQSFWYLAKPYDARHFQPCRDTGSPLEWEQFYTILEALDRSDIRLTVMYKCLTDYEQQIALRLLQVSSRSTELLQLAAPYVTYLDLSHLRLFAIQPQWLVGLTWRLKILILERNCLDLRVFDVIDEIIGVGKRVSPRSGRSQRSSPKEWYNTLCELRLDWNQMDGALPASTLAKLTDLTRLSFAHNALNTLRGVDALSTLRVLNLDYNRISNLPTDLFSLKRLEYLYLKRNQLLQPILGIGFQRLTHLRVIDLSYNGLSTVPAALFSLPQLECLKVDHNTLISLPIIQSQTHQGSRKILTIDLAYNRLTTVSTGLVRLAQHLDLSHNRIRNVPPAVLKWIANTMQRKGLRASQVIQLNLTENPLKWPPLKAVSDGTDTLMEFFHDSQTEVQTYHGLRAMLVGESKTGKSSLVLSMLDGQCRFADEREERTYAIDTFEIPFDASNLLEQSTTLVTESPTIDEADSLVEVTTTSPTEVPSNLQTTLNIWDCSASSCYQTLVQFILYQPTILAIAVDMSTYLRTQTNLCGNEISPRFHTMIGQWLEMGLVRSNHVTAVLIGTKCDLVPSAIRLEQVTRKMLHDTQAYLKERIYWFRDELRRIEALPTISPSMAHHYEQLSRIQKTGRIFVHNTVIPTSSATDPDNSSIMWHDICASLVKVTLQSPDTLQYLLAPIPSTWADVESYLESWAGSSPRTNRPATQNSQKEDPLFYERQAFSARLQIKFNVDQTNLLVLMRYLCDTGQVLAPYMNLSKEEMQWWHNVMTTGGRLEPNSLICIRPRLVLDCLKFMLNADLYQLLCPSSNQPVTETDLPKPPRFIPKLLRHFSAATADSAARRLQECSQCVHRWGALPADLWIALAEYNHLCCTGPNAEKTARDFVEFVWRWLELAYPVPDPTDGAQQFSSQEDQEQNTTDPPIELLETPLNLALAAGLYLVESTNDAPIDGLGDVMSTERPTPSPVCPASFVLPALRFPSLIADTEIDPNRHSAVLWHKACQSGPRPIRPVYRFPRGMPAGLFERATVRLNWPEELKFHYMEHWKTGVQMCHTSQQIMVRFTVDQPIDSDPSLRFEFRRSGKQMDSTKAETVKDSRQTERSDTNGSSRQSKQTNGRSDKPKWHGWPVPEEVLWDWIIPLLKALDGLLLAYQGLCYKRLMQCPKCDEATFTGEWLFPQEMQMVHSKKCVACVYKVATCLLAPPERGLEALRAHHARRRGKGEKIKLKI
ncbi:hypothetical protein D915_005182 [Fasciola hepatica]|uniref:Uncharacterized protein n=1 Tax=Fasciola hepatica TaxID=6192 RepID=A0A4E0RSH2_FASHE|nr:hypothetical protein D915_005182 [Fasciola hepatica]